MRDFATVTAIIGVIGGITCVFASLSASAAVVVAHCHPSVGRVWGPESYFTALWKETHLLIHTLYGGHMELLGIGLAVYASWTC